jgi:hypothetical protein
MLRQVEVYLNLSEGPQAMQGNMAVMWLDIRHASLSLFSSAEHNRAESPKTILEDGSTVTTEALRFHSFTKSHSRHQLLRQVRLSENEWKLSLLSNSGH